MGVILEVLGTSTGQIIKLVAKGTFEGNLEGTPPILLVIFIGYEGHRVAAIINKYEPNSIVAVEAWPPYYAGWEIPSRRENQFLLNSPNITHIRIDSRDPIKVKKQLVDLINARKLNFGSFYVAPLGTKLQAVGIYEAIKELPFIRLVYSLPKSYLAKYYSTGSGSIWEYIIHSS